MESPSFSHQDQGLCPLCGAGNRCSMAASGDPSIPCWCREVKFTAALLASIPEEAKRQVCVCRACAEAALRGETNEV